MKRIIRLTESDLTRIVRRVVNEQGFMDTVMKSAKAAHATVGISVYTSIKNLIDDAGITNWWNKDEILDELRRLKTQADYNECKAKMGGTPVSTWVRNKLGTNQSYDRSQAAYTSNPLKGLGTGLTDEEFNAEMSKILAKFKQ